MISNSTEKFKTECFVTGLYVRADGSSYTSRVGELTLDLQGIVHESTRNSKYRGFTRTSDRRVPWLPIDTEIRNQRQISMLSVEDLDALAVSLGISKIDPEWLNANFLISGLEDFSSLPRGTRMRLPNGGCILVEDRTYPCRGSGAAVKEFYPHRSNLELEFVAAAATLRGLLCTIELGGNVVEGDRLEVLVPKQWIWTPERGR